MKQFSSRKVTFFSLFLIAAVCFIAYANTFSVPFQFDDALNISEKPFVRDISLLFEPEPAWDYPGSTYVMRTVGFFTFAANYRLHGESVTGYHIVNSTIHIINGFLVYFLVLLTFRTPYYSNPSFPPLKVRGGRVGLFISLAAALLFAAHPIQTQAVTYIVQRFTSLASLFYLLSLVMYIKWRVGAYRNTPVQEAEGRRQEAREECSPLTPHSSRLSWLFYAASVISAVLAMKTKEIAFTLPLVIALYEFLFFEGALKKRIVYLVPLLLTMLIIPYGLMGSAKSVGEIIGDVSEVTKAQTAGAAVTRWDYLFTQFRVIVTYLRLLFFPAHQNLDYDYPVYRSFSDPNVFVSFLFLLAIFGLGVYLLYRSRGAKSMVSEHPPLPLKGGEQESILSPGGRGMRRGGSYSSPLTPYLSRFIAFGIFWFFITLSIESSIIPISDVIFEHRLYLPSVGFFIAVTGGIAMMWQRLQSKPEWADKAVAAALIAVVIVLSAVTYARNSVWQNEVALWEDVAKKSPSKLRVHSNLGQAYNKHGRLEEAEKEYRIALRLDPDDYQLHNNLGVVHKGQGRLDDAIREYQYALILNPDDALGYYNLGNIFREKGDFEKAIQQYQAAVRLAPDIPIIHNNLGIAFIGQGNREAAARAFRMALDLDPAYEAAKRNLERLLGGGGQ